MTLFRHRKLIAAYIYTLHISHRPLNVLCYVLIAVTTSTGTLTGVIPSEEEDDCVLAVTSLDNEVFVVRKREPRKDNYCA